MHAPGQAIGLRLRIRAHPRGRGRFDPPHSPHPPTSPTIDAPRQSNREKGIARGNQPQSSPPPRHRILIQITSRSRPWIPPGARNHRVLQTSCRLRPAVLRARCRQSSAYLLSVGGFIRQPRDKSSHSADTMPGRPDLSLLVCAVRAGGGNSLELRSQTVTLAEPHRPVP